MTATLQRRPLVKEILKGADDNLLVIAGLGSSNWDVTEAGDRPPEALAPYVEHLLATFGAERLMWGSDWPVVELVETYTVWFDLARDLLGGPAIAPVFGDVARRTYKL